MRRNPQKMWEQGVPLREAFIRFCGFPNHETDEQAEQVRSHYLILGKPAEPGEVDTRDAEWHRFQPKFIQHRKESQQKYRKALCDGLCSQLIVGKLIALGKQTEPRPSTEPEVICPAEIVNEPDRQPDEVMEADFLTSGYNIYYAAWDEDVFVGRTVRYEQVRIYDPRYNLDGTKKESAFPGEFGKAKDSIFNKPGRPSKKKEILRAFEQLKSENRIDFSGKQIDAVRLIRNYIKEHKTDEWGDTGKSFSDKAIGNHIREPFNAEKDKLKNI